MFHCNVLLIRSFYRLTRYVILACPHCAQKRGRAEFASIRQPALTRALDPPQTELECQGFRKCVGLFELHRCG